MLSRTVRRRLRVTALAALILGGVARQSLGQSSDEYDPEAIPRIAQTPQTMTVPPYREPFGEPIAPEGGMAPPPTAPAPPLGAFEPAFGGTQFAALGGPGAAVAFNEQIGGLGGYIDSAIPRSLIRVRYDAAYENNRPDRAEFFYPQCGCLFLAPPEPNLTPGKLHSALRAYGPPLAERRIDFQELSTYLEYAPTLRFSAFVDVPVRFINPEVNRNAYGFSDMILGFKYALVARPSAFYTFQFKTYVPTGVGHLGLGTNHASLEPGILAFQQLSERMFFIGQVRDWIPIRGTTFVGAPGTGEDAGAAFAGNIINYGAGVFYNVLQSANVRVAPIAEFVGWTALGGLQSLTFAPNFESASGDTIVNAKIGVRFAVGDYFRPGGGSALNDRASIYVGYARALTGDVWYKNMFRLEAVWYF